MKDSVRNAIAFALIAVAGLSFVPLDKIKSVIPDLGKIVTPDNGSKDGTVPASIQKTVSEMDAHWAKVEQLARTKSFKSFQEASDYISSRLSEAAQAGVQVLQDDLDKTVKKDSPDWQEALANAAARYQRESK